MTEAEARAVLVELDYSPGRDNTADPRHRPHAETIKAACRVLLEVALAALRPQGRP